MSVNIASDVEKLTIKLPFPFFSPQLALVNLLAITSS